MQDSGPFRATNVPLIAHDRADPDRPSDNEGDEDPSKSDSEPDDEILSQAPANVQTKGKGKVADLDGGGQKKMQKKSRWLTANNCNIDFNLNVTEVIESLKAGQLLTADEVYSAPEWHGFPATHPRREVHLCIKTLKILWISQTCL